jgi:hypothetical protein
MPRQLPNAPGPSPALVSDSGVTKDVLEYHNLDDSLMLNPRIEIRDPRKLLAVPDEDFQKLDSSQRSTLVPEFSVSLRETTDAKHAPQNQ